MRYEMMFPHQIRTAIAENWPVAVPLGVLEYHGEHLSLGVDTFIPQGILSRVEEKHAKMVIMPTFWYGAASYCVAPPEGNGSIQVTAESLYRFAKDYFKSLLRIGFRNVHCFVFHQSENFYNGMPTDLAFRLGAREVIFEFLEKGLGEGFWGEEKMANYYQEHENATDPFNWVQIHPLMNAEILRDYSIDHAGKVETSLMMALCPDGVDMSRHSREKWYSRTATEAKKDYVTPLIVAAVKKVEKDLRL
jgi:creatinine amidohydrolase/Fe(II)-dependent formamide hydrolase-like protein